MSTSEPTPKTSTAKAYVGAAIAAVVAGLSTAVTALDDGVISAQEGITITIAVFVSLGSVFGGVYGVTNKPLR
jgi:hypothetical protein